MSVPKKQRTDAMLDFWVTHNKNVLFIGRHGVGKTAMIKEVFDRHGLNWRYFSAATMDPWVDFVGVPRATKDQNGAEFLELIRPRGFHDGTVEALFFDEFNRSPKKVRNAVMELLQFRSINGIPFPNLKMIWAAVNPDDDEEGYDVETIDPAQLDRFHIHVNVPYEPVGEYFQAQYGERTAKAAIDWWKSLSADEQKLVSPRRLDYALKMHLESGDLRWVLPVTVNASKLTQALNTGPTGEKLEALMTAGDLNKGRAFLANENNYAAAMHFIPRSQTMMEFFVPLLPKEKIASLLAEPGKEEVSSFIMQNLARIPVFREVCQDVVDAGTNPVIVKKIRKAVSENAGLAKAFTQTSPNPDKPYFVADAKGGETYSKALRKLREKPVVTPGQRDDVYQTLRTLVPKQMTVDQAVETLDTLKPIVEKAFNANLPKMESLVGIINHCLSELNRETGLGFEGLAKVHIGRFGEMFSKLKDAGLNDRVLLPSGNNADDLIK